MIKYIGKDGYGNADTDRRTVMEKTDSNVKDNDD